MRDLKKIILVCGASAVLALTGCEMINHHSGDRTAGRMLDDTTITASVKHDLHREPIYKFDDVDVKTYNGVVQLSGFVSSEEQKQRAAEIAQRAEGVTQVMNNITVMPSNNLTPTSRPNDWNQPQPAQPRY